MTRTRIHDLKNSSEMVEVFKTNVNKSADAKFLLEEISRNFPEYEANFDLEDCDKILRIKDCQETIQSAPLINLLRHFGFEAEILPDTIPDFGDFLRQQPREIFTIMN